jgi:hypothetical protein
VSEAFDPEKMRRALDDAGGTPDAPLPAGAGGSSNAEDRGERSQPEPRAKTRVRPISPRKKSKERAVQADATVQDGAPLPAVRSSDCPRWMHHRKGEYCKTCGRMQ